jgi:propanol-preferring alcohol dehydrogenase
VLKSLNPPTPKRGEILIKVLACGVCHTELDEIEGRTPPPTLPVTLGHQVVGIVAAHGPETGNLPIGARVGVGWVFSTCGTCSYCLSGRENLCPSFRATGRDADGGYAEWMAVPEAFATPIPENITDAQAAPLLCAGAVGYRSLRLAEIRDGEALGLSGFGASGHLVLQMARHLYPGSSIYVFARSPVEQSFANELGAAWAGDFLDQPPVLMDAIIDTTPVWTPIVASLARLAPGGKLVINAIRKEDADQEALLGINYPSHLWMEKRIQSVANVTRKDIQEFLNLASSVPLKPEVQEFPLEDANQALLELKQRKIRGAKVLRIN